jgi:hypothetical protein
MGDTYLVLSIFLIFLILIPLTQAETTFFDNPDEVFIMGNPTTGGLVITEELQARGGGSSGSCLYKWNCTNWTECLPPGKQTRICTNIGTCSDNYKTPEMTRNCIFNFEINGKIILGYVKNENIVYIIFIVFCLTILLLILKFTKKIR